MDKNDKLQIRKAFDIAVEAHSQMRRKSGEPYIVHPLAAAQILADMRIDPTIVTATLLHDVPEDTAVTLENIEKNFDIGGLCGLFSGGRMFGFGAKRRRSGCGGRIGDEKSG